VRETGDFGLKTTQKTDSQPLGGSLGWGESFKSKEAELFLLKHGRGILEFAKDKEEILGEKRTGPKAIPLDSKWGAKESIRRVIGVFSILINNGSKTTGHGDIVDPRGPYEGVFNHSGRANMNACTILAGRELKGKGESYKEKGTWSTSGPWQ